MLQSATSLTLSDGKMESSNGLLLPHVLIFPLPAQGHVNSMLKLAELLASSGLRVTFLNSGRNHDRLLRHTDILARFSCYPHFSLKTISDGLPSDHPRTGHQAMDLIESIKTVTAPLFRELLMTYKTSEQPVSCIIADGIYGFAIDAAKEIGIKCMAFRTISASCFWAYFSLPRVIEAGDIPFKDDDMDRLISSVPGMEGTIRLRDLPSFCRVDDPSDPSLQAIIKETIRTPLAHGHMFNTFDELEGPILAQIRLHCPNLYTVGPLHALVKSKLNHDKKRAGSSNSLWEVDRTCMTWLDSQPAKSVVYVSFGSITTLKRDQLMEFWHGLVNSKKRFLWVIRPDSVTDEDGHVPTELQEATKERGYTVDWAPQEEVLAHGSVGGFLTHSGWNSTVESISAGVPMICWPFFADQQVNSRFVSEVWKLGLDMKDTCHRDTVEKVVNELMDSRREEFTKSAIEMAELARKTVTSGGSSFSNLNRLVEDLRQMI